MNAKEKKSVRVQNKTAQFMFKTSPELIEILNDLADKKGMSKGGLIEYLLRREFDFLVNPIFSKPQTYLATPQELASIDRGLEDLKAGRSISEEEAEAEIETLWEE